MFLRGFTAMVTAVLPDFGFRVTLLPGRLRSRGGAALDRLVCARWLC